MPIYRIIKPESWNGKSLTGEWLITLKIDGVRAIWHKIDGWVSRAGKPLYNIPALKDEPPDCELFLGSFRDTIRATRTKNTNLRTPLIRREHLFELDPPDLRLSVGETADPCPNEIFDHLHRVNAKGHEGLVLRQSDWWIKVKPIETYDLSITLERVRANMLVALAFSQPPAVVWAPASQMMTVSNCWPKVGPVR